MAGTNFNPSWSDSIKWNSPAGGGGFGGGVSPGSSFEPSPGFPSVGDSGFWQNQPTDPNYYNKGKNFLDAFTKGLGDSSKNKYQDQAQQGGFQTGGGKESSGGNIGKLAPDLSIYTPPTAHQPFREEGTPAKPGFGGILGQVVGTIGGALIGGPAGASLGGSLGGAIGGSF
jgi:hypothetical protein